MSQKNRRWLPCLDSRFEAYLAYETTIPVFETTHKQTEVPDMFTGETLSIKKRQPHLELLPYTLEALQRRKARGADVPEWMEEKLEQSKAPPCHGGLDLCELVSASAPQSVSSVQRRRDVAV